MTASSIPADGAQESVGPYVEDADLARGLARLRRRTAMVPTERWLAVAGGVLMPLGVVLVLAGWYGASHTTRLFEEIPYLISGGMLGIVLSAIGAALYFGYWLTRLVAGDRQIVEVLARIEARLDASESNGSGGSTAAAGAVGAAFVATRTGTMFHRPQCPVVADRPDKELRRITLPASGMSPCKLCAPLD
ncbi:MAG: hypothetical protein JWP02_1103 [Acidimicrobiales bacterium]|nr:hypothetical protein [Acidimicrobiales bacterium]